MDLSGYKTTAPKGAFKGVEFEGFKMIYCPHCKELAETNPEAKCYYHDDRDDWYYDDTEGR